MYAVWYFVFENSSTSKYEVDPNMLLRLGRSTIDLFEHLTNQILSQVSKFAAAIKEQAIEYSNMMGVPSESLLLWDHHET
jgi:hypothetical protein